MLREIHPIKLLRGLVFATLLGAAIIFLLGPAVAVAGTILPFALVGGIAWGGYHLGRRTVRRLSGQRLRIVPEDVPPAPTPVAQPQPKIEPVHVKCSVSSCKPSQFRSRLRTAAYVAIEVGCGAILGAALSFVVESQIGTVDFQRLAIGAGIGAVVGFVVGGSRPGTECESDCESEVSSQAA